MLRSTGSLPPHIVGSYEEATQLPAGRERHLLRLRSPRPHRAHGGREQDRDAQDSGDRPGRRTRDSADRFRRRRRRTLRRHRCAAGAAARADLRSQRHAADGILSARHAGGACRHRQRDAERRRLGAAHRLDAADQPSGKRRTLYRILTRRIRATQHRTAADHGLRRRSRGAHRDERRAPARRSHRRVLLRVHHRHGRSSASTATRARSSSSGTSKAANWMSCSTTSRRGGRGAACRTARCRS